MDYNPQNAQQFGIPTAAGVAYTYVNGGAVNDLILTATYLAQDGIAVLGVLTFSYDGNGNLTGIQRTA